MHTIVSYSQYRFTLWSDPNVYYIPRSINLSFDNNDHTLVI